MTPFSIPLEIPTDPLLLNTCTIDAIARQSTRTRTARAPFQRGHVVRARDTRVARAIRTRIRVNGTLVAFPARRAEAWDYGEEGGGG